MYHSITFGDGSIFTYGTHEKKGLAMGANTWDDWHLIPSARPEIAAPEVYKNYVDLPAAHGKIDLSEYLTGGPVYKNRTGSVDFYMKDGYGFWAERINQINNFLHGRRLFMTLEDEPQYTYHGRFEVQNPRCDSGNGFSMITIAYELDPFKFLLPRATFDDIWDRFLFEDTHQYQFMKQIDASASPVFSIPGYVNGFMLDGEIDDESGFPASATVQLNSSYMTLARTNASSATEKDSQLSPVAGAWNTIRVTGSGLVNLYVFGGCL